MRKIRVIIIGAGGRGVRYANEMLKMQDKYEIVGMADPSVVRQRRFQEKYGVLPEKCFASWKDILSQPKMADVAVIATMDNMHYHPALRAIELGYDLLLEKPVAQTAQECVDIANAAKKKGVNVLVCHVLRYSPFYGKVKELVLAGTIGEVISIEQVEGIGNMHFAHNYVRGNWRCEAETTPMLLAKSCHDLDIIQWMLDKSCKYVSSFGSLRHFTAENAPQGAPDRCVDGGCPVEDSCPYNCIRHYYDDKTNTRRKAVSRGFVKDFVPTDEEVMNALRCNDYGLCVYHANNDVLDHQIVSMEFEDGVTATLTVNAFNKGGRYIRIYGTKGEIFAHMADTEIHVYTFEDKASRTVPVPKTTESIDGGHGGGDRGIVEEMYEYLSGTYEGFRAADITTSVSNHLIGFAAEEARHRRTVVNVDEFCSRLDFMSK